MFAMVKGVTRLGVSVVALASASAALLPGEEKQQRPATDPRQEIRAYLVKKVGRYPAGVAVPGKSPWVWCAEQYAAVPKQDPRTLYYLVSEHLLIAERRYLNSKDLEVRRKGLGMVSEAAQCASQRLKDHALAVKIAEGYVLPHLEAADDRHWKYLGRQNVLEAVADVYAQANDADKFIEMLKLILENAHNRNTADAARLRLARMLDTQGKYQEALRYLREIDENEGVGGGRRLIPIIEKKIQAKK